MLSLNQQILTRRFSPIHPRNWFQMMQRVNFEMETQFRMNWLNMAKLQALQDEISVQV